MTRDAASPRSLSPLRASSRVAAVVSQYHGELTGAMLASARGVLEEAGLSSEDLFVVEVPGAYELPLVADRLARSGDFAAVLCFGLVLRGETDHDRYISTAVADALMRSSLERDVPILFGVLTCNTLEQAQRRAATEAEGGLDKGREVARAALGVLAALERVEAR